MAVVAEQHEEAVDVTVPEVGIAEPAVEGAAPAVAAAAAPAVDDPRPCRVQIAALQAQLEALDSSAEPAAPEAPARLPGTEEAARIAAEMAALAQATQAVGNCHPHRRGRTRTCSDRLAAESITDMRRTDQGVTLIRPRQ